MYPRETGWVTEQTIQLSASSALHFFNTHIIFSQFRRKRTKIYTIRYLNSHHIIIFRWRSFAIAVSVPRSRRREITKYIRCESPLSIFFFFIVHTCKRQTAEHSRARLIIGLFFLSVRRNTVQGINGLQADRRWRQYPHRVDSNFCTLILNNEFFYYIFYTFQLWRFVKPEKVEPSVRSRGEVCVAGTIRFNWAKVESSPVLNYHTFISLVV